MSSFIYLSVDTLPQAPVNNLDEITQIVLFLSVTCRVIIGVSRSSCNLIMKIMSIILFLAFRRSDNGLNSSHTNILKQIPMTSESVEAVMNSGGVMPIKANQDLDWLKLRFIGLWTPAGSRAYSRTKASLLPKEFEFEYQREPSRFKLEKYK
jgi:hypothetical protein